MLHRLRVVAGEWRTYNITGRFFRLVSAEGPIRARFRTDNGDSYFNGETPLRAPMGIEFEQPVSVLEFYGEDSQTIEVWHAAVPMDYATVAAAGAARIKTKRVLCKGGKTLLTSADALRASIRIRPTDAIRIGSDDVNGLNGWEVGAGQTEVVEVAGSVYAYMPPLVVDVSAAAYVGQALNVRPFTSGYSSFSPGGGMFCSLTSGTNVQFRPAGETVWQAKPIPNWNMLKPAHAKKIDSESQWMVVARDDTALWAFAADAEFVEGWKQVGAWPSADIPIPTQYPQAAHSRDGKVYFTIYDCAYVFNKDTATFVKVFQSPGVAPLTFWTETSAGIIASFSSKTWLSKDGGSTWVEKFSASCALYKTEQTGDVIVTSSSSGVRWTADGGETWSLVTYSASAPGNLQWQSVLI